MPIRKEKEKLTRPVKLTVTLTREEHAAVDAARGLVPFASWARSRILGPGADGLRVALLEIASLDDEAGNDRLARSGDFSGFDEPASVAIARRAIQAAGISVHAPKKGKRS